MSENGAVLDVTSLVEKHLNLVKSIARRFKGRLPAFVLFDDLVSWGNEGLLRGATRYDPGKGRFASFAAPAIWGAMKDGLRTSDWPGRSVRDRMPADQIPCMRDFTYYEDETVSVDRPSDTDGPEALTEGHDIWAWAEDQLESREVVILRLMCGEGWTLRETGDALGISESNVCGIYRRIRGKLRDAVDLQDGRLVPKPLPAGMR